MYLMDSEVESDSMTTHIFHSSFILSFSQQSLLTVDCILGIIPGTWDSSSWAAGWFLWTEYPMWPTLLQLHEEEEPLDICLILAETQRGTLIYLKSQSSGCGRSRTILLLSLNWAELYSSQLANLAAARAEPQPLDYSPDPPTRPPSSSYPAFPHTVSLRAEENFCSLSGSKEGGEWEATFQRPQEFGEVF